MEVSVSDIIESMTGISYPLGVGRGSSYWNSRFPCKEFFAETLDGAASNEGSYSFLKRMFPRSVAVVHKILESGLDEIIRKMDASFSERLL